jgi:hypothetical protein
LHIIRFFKYFSVIFQNKCLIQKISKLISNHHIKQLGPAAAGNGGWTLQVGLPGSTAVQNDSSYQPLVHTGVGRAL